MFFFPFPKVGNYFQVPAVCVRGCTSSGYFGVLSNTLDRLNKSVDDQHAANSDL